MGAARMTYSADAAAADKRRIAQSLLIEPLTSVDSIVLHGLPLHIRLIVLCFSAHRSNPSRQHAARHASSNLYYLRTIIGGWVMATS